MTEKRFKQVLGGIKDTKLNRLLKTPMGLVLQYADVFNKCIEWLNELQEENEQLKSTNMEMEDYLGRLEEENINLQTKLQKIRDYAKEDGGVKQGVIEKVILND